MKSVEHHLASTPDAEEWECKGEHKHVEKDFKVHLQKRTAKREIKVYPTSGTG